MTALTLRGVFAHKRRLVATALAIVVGVAFMLGSLVVSHTVKTALADVNVATEQHTDVLVRGSAHINDDNGTQHGVVPASLATRIARVPGVAAVSPRITGYAQVLGADGQPIDDLGNGATPLGEAWSPDPALNPFQLTAGHGPTDPSDVVIDRRTATRAHLAVGSTVTILTTSQPRRFTVTGIAGFAGGDSKAGVSSTLFTPRTAATLLGDGHDVQSLAVRAMPGVGQGVLAHRIAAILPTSAQAVTGATLAAENRHLHNADANFFATFTLIFAVVALLVGAFIINNTFSILVAQRTRELGVLRALGASGRQVRRSVFTEALVVGVAASAVGLGAGVGVAHGLKALLSGFGLPLPPTPIQVTTSALLTSFLVGVVVTVGSAMLPARRASRVSPITAIRDSAGDVPGSRRRTVLGLAVTAVGVTGVLGGVTAGRTPPTLFGALLAFLGVAVLGPVFVRPVVRVIGAGLPRLRGMRGRLARENAMRNPRRSAATAAALMVGVSLVVAMTSFVASAKSSIGGSFDREFHGTYALDSGAWIYGGISPTAAAQAARLPGVQAIAAQQRTQADIAGTTSELSGWDPRQLPQVFDLGVRSGSVASLGDDGIAVGTSYADKHRLRLGQRLPVTFKDGTRQAFTVRAVFRHSDWTGQAWISRAAFGRDLPGALDTTVYVKGSGAALHAGLARIAAAYPTATLRDRAQISAAQTAVFDKALGLVYALLALTILIALFGIANTVALSVVERTRELGVLRAVGMQRSELRSMVRWEAATVSAFGAVMGVVIGLFLGRSLVFAVAQSGIETANFVVPAGQVAVVVLVAAAAGVLAAWLPARRAARLDVLRAIAAT